MKKKSKGKKYRQKARKSSLALAKNKALQAKQEKEEMYRESVFKRMGGEVRE